MPEDYDYKRLMIKCAKTSCKQWRHAYPANPEKYAATKVCTAQPAVDWKKCQTWICQDHLDELVRGTKPGCVACLLLS